MKPPINHLYGRTTEGKEVNIILTSDAAKVRELYDKIRHADGKHSGQQFEEIFWQSSASRCVQQRKFGGIYSLIGKKPAPKKALQKGPAK